MWRVAILALMTLSYVGCSPAYRFQHPVTGAIGECNYIQPVKQQTCVNSWLASGYVRIP